MVSQPKQGFVQNKSPVTVLPNLEAAWRGTPVLWNPWLALKLPALLSRRFLLLWSNRGCGQPSPSPPPLAPNHSQEEQPARAVWRLGTPPHPQNARDPKTYFTCW